MSQEKGWIRRRILGVLTIDYRLVNTTGLLIRSPSAKAVIGGHDIQPMIIKKKYMFREPMGEGGGKTEGVEVEVPFIPGSSIKGRMRSLLELYEGARLYFDGKIHIHVRDLNRQDRCNDLDHALDNLFGSPSIQVKNVVEKKDLLKDIQDKIAPTRLIVEDVFPSEKYVLELLNRYGVVSKEDFLEEKSENRIDRITSAADPRFILRVKPDVEFAGRMTLLLFDVDYKYDKIKEYLDLLLTGFKLIEDTYLGGSGTRGYGKVRFKDLVIRLRTPGYYLGKEDEIEIVKAGSIDELLKTKDEVLSKINEYIGKYVGEEQLSG